MMTGQRTPRTRILAWLIAAGAGVAAGLVPVSLAIATTGGESMRSEDDSVQKEHDDARRHKIELTKTSDKATYAPGETIHYAITVKNKGAHPLAIQNVHVTDQMLGAGELTPPPGTMEIPAGGSVSYSGSKAVTAANCGWVRNRAAVVVDGAEYAKHARTAGEGVDGDESNEPKSERDHAVHKVKVVCREDLDIEKTADAMTYKPGDTIKYTLTVTNSGHLPIAVNRILVTDASLPNLQLTGQAPKKLTPGAKLVYTGSRTVTAANCGPIVNTATVALAAKPKHRKDKDDDKDKGDHGKKRLGTSRAAAPRRLSGEPHKPSPPPRELDSDTLTVTVVCGANLRIVKTANPMTYQPQDTITYTVTVTNTGETQVPTGQIVVSDSLTTLTLVNPSPLPASLGPGQTLTYTGTFKAPASECDRFTNTATVSTSPPIGETNLTDNQSSVTVTCTTALPAPAAVGTPPAGTALQIDKSGPEASRGRSLIPYRIRVTNTGTSTAVGVVISDRLPAGTTLARVPRRATLKSGRVRWSVGDLQPGASVTVGLWLRPAANRSVRICNTSTVGGANTPLTQDTACTSVAQVAGVSRPPTVTG